MIGPSVEPLTSTIGARITGINLAEDIASEVAEQIRQALWTYGVLVFPGQALTQVENQRFADIFGSRDPHPHPVFRYFGGDADASNTIEPTTIQYVTQGNAWHSDGSYAEIVPFCATLRALVISPIGGDTCWTSMYAAYDQLSDTMKHWLLTATAIHSSLPNDEPSLRKRTKDQREGFLATFPPRAQPVVVAHPVSGRKLLYVNPVYTRSIVGLTSSESSAMLDFLFAHSTQSNMIYRHHWNVDDLVVWDELGTSIFHQMISRLMTGG